jgi:hypothetical protein
VEEECASVLVTFPPVELTSSHVVARELRRTRDEVGDLVYEGRVRCSCRRTQYLPFTGQPTVPSAEWLLFLKAKLLHVCNCGPVLLTDA